MAAWEGKGFFLLTTGRSSSTTEGTQAGIWKQELKQGLKQRLQNKQFLLAGWLLTACSACLLTHSQTIQVPEMALPKVN